MSSFSARRALMACLVCAAGLVALVAPGVASAEIKIAKCAGTSITGAGSSFQLEAQEIFRKKFNEPGKGTCPGGPTISYESIGSGAGYKKWQVSEEYGPNKFGFIGTDNAANEAEILKIDAEAVPASSSALLTFPVVQGAEAIVVNLPANCAANSAVAPGRLAMNSQTLEEIYRGEVTKWSQILGSEFGGNELTGVGCEPTTDAFTPVVRNDGSGTTHIFKRYFALLDPTAKFEAEDGGTYSWGELAEGTPSKIAGKSLNQMWPKGVVTRAATTTNTGLLKEVGSIPGAIGYADLAQARNPANGEFAKGGKEFWMVLENKKKVKGGIVKSRSYNDPSTDGLSTTVAESNCKKTVYVNGNKEFPPPTLEAAWTEVGANTESKTYALCGLTYDFALTHYSSYSGKGATEGEAATVRDYISFLTSKKGGQVAIKEHDYAGMPKQLLNEDAAGIAKIGY
jgi:ABC-type phosphate transport system substrate-binding protein